MNLNKIIGAILLVSCTTIGAGILALPTATHQAGFLPITATMLVCWLFMTVGALCILELNLCSQTETNIISMADKTLGMPGKLLAWTAYMALLYALISAYLTASSAWLSRLIFENFTIAISQEVSVPLVAVLLGMMIFLGTAVADQFNKLFSIGLVITYVILIATGIGSVDHQALTIGAYPAAITTMPLLVTSFGFAIIVPSLTTYLNFQARQMLIVILIGSLIPLVVYLLWEAVTLGILNIPGKNGLAALAQNQANGTEVAIALENVLGNPIISVSARIFSIFAICTSLLGVSLSLFHFLADGLQMSQKGMSGIKLFALTFVPPIAIVLFFPAGFDAILSFGGIFVAILLGILPILMVYAKRHYTSLQSSFTLPGGNLLLGCGLIFFCYVIFQELVNVYY